MAKLTKEGILSHIAHPQEHYDVIVLGGGPAGIGAALAAAMCGRRPAYWKKKRFSAAWPPYPAGCR